jgi:hypothetical protein
MSKKVKKNILFLIFLFLAILWGSYQPKIFPIETYSILCFITSFAGGSFLGFVMGYLFDLIDEKE